MATDFELNILRTHSTPSLRKAELTPTEHYKKLRGGGFSHEAAADISGVEKMPSSQPTSPETSAPPPSSEPQDDHDHLCPP